MSSSERVPIGDAAVARSGARAANDRIPGRCPAAVAAVARDHYDATTRGDAQHLVHDRRADAPVRAEVDQDRRAESTRSRQGEKQRGSRKGRPIHCGVDHDCRKDGAQRRGGIDHHRVADGGDGTRDDMYRESPLRAHRVARHRRRHGRRGGRRRGRAVTSRLGRSARGRKHTCDHRGGGTARHARQGRGA
jgi:hypothetical protein